MSFTDFLAAHLRRLAAYLIGPAADRPVAGWFTVGDLAMVLTPLALASMGHVALATYARWQRGAAVPAAGNTPATTRRHVVAAASRPLTALVWTYAVYFAAAPLAGRFKPGSEVASARAALDQALNVAAYLMLCWFAYRSTYVIEDRLRHWTSGTARRYDELLLPLLGSWLRIGVVAAGIIVFVTIQELPPRLDIIANRITSIVLIASMALLLLRSVAAGQRLILGRFDTSVADNLRARQVATQLHIILRLVYIMIGLFAVAAVLMLFPTVRHVGTSLLASAGIAGVIVGFAAQKILGNLFAGIQIAMSQTIRQDDVVVVEGEWGRIEEIALTYVVVHLWDDRRLVLPLSYFIEKPFQNWTRTTAALTGSITLWVDYEIDVAAARDALREIIESSALWDRRFWNLQVSDLSEKTVQLRVLASAADSGRSWDLRCEVREKFIAYLQRHHPASLPRSRTELVGTGTSMRETQRQPQESQ